MAIAYDNATSGSNTTGTSLTYSHTCTGSDLFLVVWVLGEYQADNLTGITYGGVAMTLINKIQKTSDRWSYLYGLTAPATGANNVVVSSSPSSFMQSGAASYTGVKQTGQPEAQASAQATSTACQVSVTTVTNNAWVVGAFGSGDSTPTALAGTTFRVGIDDGKPQMCDSGIVATAGSTTIGATVDSGQWAAHGASLAPVPTAILKTWNGVAIADIKTFNGVAIADIKTFNGVA